MYTGGLSIELNGETYEDGAEISITAVGIADNDAVLCRTDLTTCCGSSMDVLGQGDWVYPNGTEVGNRRSYHDIFRTRGDRVVRLQRNNSDITAPTGQYCCKVATMNNTNASICITLGKALHQSTHAK